MLSIDFSDGINNALELSIVSSAERVDDIITKLKKAVDNHVNPNHINIDYFELSSNECLRIKKEIEKYIRSKGNHYALY